MIIVGAGMAGLLAANMLRRYEPAVIEKAKALPNNHSAVLRFRSSIVGDTLGIPFRKVQMIKSVLPWRNPVADALQYSFKNTGIRRSDRSIISGLTSETRYIAPSDLINQMANSVQILFDTNFEYQGDGTPVISTMPMPGLMKLLGYEPDVEFHWTNGTTIRATIQDCDAYVSLIVPNPEYKFSRLSITGDELFIEVHNCENVNSTFSQLSNSVILSQVAELLGIDEDQFINIIVKHQRYSKINPVDDSARKKFMHWATVHHNIYSLGRYATWRPSLLLDDLVKDVRLIAHWIRQGNNYEVSRVS